MLVYLVVPRAELCDWIAAGCSALGHRVRQYSSGELAIDACAQQACDVLVVDRSLPGRDGLMTIETVRGLEHGRSIRVGLLLESEAHGAAPMLASRVDATSVLVGDGDQESVALFVERLLRTKSASEGANPSNPVLPSSTTKLMALSNPFTGEVELPEQRPTYVDGTPREGETLRSRANRQDSDVLLLSTEGEALVDESSFEEATWVERAIRDAEKKVDRIEGNFEVTPFAELLAQIANEKRDGGLVCSGLALGRRTVDGHAPTKVICFRAGVPVDVRSNLLDESLLALLLRQRRISGVQYEAACRMEREHAMSAEDVILQQKLLDPVGLADVLAEQLRLKIIDLFGWRTGEYFLATNVEPPPRAVGLPYSFAELLYDGVRMAMPMSWLMEYVAAHKDTVLSLHSASLSRAARLPLDGVVSRALRGVSSTITVRDFVARASADGQTRAAMEALYTLVCLGVLRASSVEPLAGFVPEHLLRTVEVPTAAHPQQADPEPQADAPTRVVDIATLRLNSNGPEAEVAAGNHVPWQTDVAMASEQRALAEHAARDTVRGFQQVASAQDLVVSGFALLRDAKWSDAQSAFGAALLMEPSRQDALAYRALASIGLLRSVSGEPIDDKTAALYLGVLMQAVAAHPRSASLHFSLARAHELLGNTQAARDAVRLSLAIDPSHEDAVQLLRRVTTSA